MAEDGILISEQEAHSPFSFRSHTMGKRTTEEANE